MSTKKPTQSIGLSGNLRIMSDGLVAELFESEPVPALESDQILYPSELSDLDGEWVKVGTHTIIEAEQIYPLSGRGPFAIMPARLRYGRRLADVYERTALVGLPKP